MNAEPTMAGGPYPVIIFAHGFDTEPSDYAPLLDAWVRAGFVVVSPVFPDENAQAVESAGGVDNAQIANAMESDEFNEPGDIVYVLRQLENISNFAWGQHLQPVLDLSDVAFAGQSDGADVVAALTFASSLRHLYASLPVAPKAVAILSGSAWGTSFGSYASRANSPALLQVQSDADGCNLPAAGVDLFSDLQIGHEQKLFVTLFGADHLSPYEGVHRWAPVVERVTTAFFELELHWRLSASLNLEAVELASNASNISHASRSVSANTMPRVAANGGCEIPA